MIVETIRQVVFASFIVCLVLPASGQQLTPLPSTINSNSPESHATPMDQSSGSYQVNLEPVIAGQSQMRMRLVVPATVREIVLVSHAPESDPMQISIQHLHEVRVEETAGKLKQNKTPSIQTATGVKTTERSPIESFPSSGWNNFSEKANIQLTGLTHITNPYFNQDDDSRSQSDYTQSPTGLLNSKPNTRNLGIPSKNSLSNDSRNENSNAQQMQQSDQSGELDDSPESAKPRSNLFQAVGKLLNLKPHNQPSGPLTTSTPSSKEQEIEFAPLAPVTQFHLGDSD